MRKPRGFAAMSKRRVRAIAKLGGLAISKNIRHMREIGRKGGYRSHSGTPKREFFNWV